MLAGSDLATDLRQNAFGIVIGAACALLLALVFAKRGPGAALTPVALLAAVLLVTNVRAAVATSVLLILVVPSTEFFVVTQLGVPRVALLLPAAALVISPAFRPRFALTDAVVIGFAVFITVSSVFVGSTLQLLLLTLVPLAFYGVGRCIGGRPLVTAVLWAITVGAVLGSLTVLYEYVYAHHALFTDATTYYWNAAESKIFRPGGVYTSPPGASLMLAMAAPAILALAMTTTGPQRRFVIGAFAIVVAGIAVTFTRGGYIALLAACVGFFLLAFSGSARRRFIFVAVAAAVAIIVLIPTWSSTTWFQEGVARAGTFTARQSYWDLAFPVIGESMPSIIFGHGFNSLLLARPELGGHAISGSVIASPVLIDRGPHNQYILTLLETGALGLLLFLAWLVVPLVRGIVQSIKAQDEWTRAVSAGFAMAIVAFIAMCLVGDQLRYVPSVMFVALITGILQSLTQSTPRRSGPVSERVGAEPTR